MANFLGIIRPLSGSDGAGLSELPYLTSSDFKPLHY